MLCCAVTVALVQLMCCICCHTQRVSWLWLLLPVIMFVYGMVSFRSISQSNGVGMCGLAMNPTIPFGGYVAPEPSEAAGGLMAWLRYWTWVLSREIHGLAYSFTIWFDASWQVIWLVCLLLDIQ